MFTSAMYERLGTQTRDPRGASQPIIWTAISAPVDGSAAIGISAPKEHG
jgi:hypothetical protein